MDRRKRLTFIFPHDIKAPLFVFLFCAHLFGFPTTFTTFHKPIQYYFPPFLKFIMIKSENVTSRIFFFLELKYHEVGQKVMQSLYRNVK